MILQFKYSSPDLFLYFEIGGVLEIPIKDNSRRKVLENESK